MWHGAMKHARAGVTLDDDTASVYSGFFATDVVLRTMGEAT